MSVAYWRHWEQPELTVVEELIAAVAVRPCVIIYNCKGDVGLHRNIGEYSIDTRGVLPES